MTVQQLIDRLSALSEHMKKAEVFIRAGSASVSRTDLAESPYALDVHDEMVIIQPYVPRHHTSTKV